jgi:S-adenosylmethionine hydrolase
VVRAQAARVRGIVTLLTDFGTRDGYVGAVKGVVLSRCPEAHLVDVSHEIPPGDVAAASWVLGQAAPWFPPGTVHLVVVDPGVGSTRRAVALEVAGQRYVAPDNGVLSRVLAAPPILGRDARAYELTERGLWLDPPSAVFHGRDLFAPVAGYLAAGGSIAGVGSELPLAGLARSPWPEPVLAGDTWTGQVVWVDRFGNLVTNLSLAPGAAGEVEAGGRHLPVHLTYSDVAAGELLALTGSSGLLELACNRGSAAEVLGLGAGGVVTCSFRLLGRPRSRS